MPQSNQLVIIGFGSQAKAWALNLKDSGYEVFIALRDQSPSIIEAKNLGLETIPLENERLLSFQTFILLTPDNTHHEILEKNKNFLSKNSRIIYAHGFSLCTHNLQSKYPDLEHLLLAPKAIASEVRFRYQTKDKLGAVKSVEFAKDQMKASEFIDELSSKLGITAGPYKSSFLEETNADLFSEQSLLCSLIPYGALTSYQKLREKGVSKEIAYLECWFEVKLIADAMVQMGPDKFFQLISPNALLGGEKAKELIFDKAYREKLDTLLNHIWGGDFSKECQEADFHSLRENVLNFWRSQELSQTHDELAPQLY